MLFPFEVQPLHVSSSLGRWAINGFILCSLAPAANFVPASFIVFQGGAPNHPFEEIASVTFKIPCRKKKVSQQCNLKMSGPNLIVIASNPQPFRLVQVFFLRFCLGIICFLGHLLLLRFFNILMMKNRMKNCHALKRTLWFLQKAWKTLRPTRRRLFPIKNSGDAKL